MFRIAAVLMIIASIYVFKNANEVTKIWLSYLKKRNSVIKFKLPGEGFASSPYYPSFLRVWAVLLFLMGVVFLIFGGGA